MQTMWAVLTATAMLVGCNPAPAKQSEVQKPPSTLSAKDRFDLKRYCMELGAKKSAAEYKAPDDIDLGATYCYSETLNTCLYFRQTMKIGSKDYYSEIVDVTSNRNIAKYLVDKQGVSRQMPEDEFKAKERELWNSCLK